MEKAGDVGEQESLEACPNRRSPIYVRLWHGVSAGQATLIVDPGYWPLF